ncbi:ABC transporter permease [Actinotalea ferrariae CF5-4]|uniref:ABC transporter permease n=1 Tax=Actinotalea ferrariae CF5-4 TaxID=948458 RepID=A0A021VRZ0_9CELL|nr:ABC transporter permease [Actinotalea ferrariae]EYR63878.1 ABC transporter permease [Actinotalea ferrariae CF5-4]
MITFIGRRLLSSAVVLLGATFIVYMLLAYSLDFLQDLRTSTAPNKEQLIQARIDLLDLDVPPPLRYLSWLGGVAGCAIGRCDLGGSWVTGQATPDLLATAIPSSLQLMSVAVVLAILLGVTVGITSALRQYTGFDYGVTFGSFLLYSLPSFWVAVLLKLWGAIGFNDFLADPTLSWPTILAIAVVAGLIWQAVIAGDRRRRALTFAVSAVATGAVVWFVTATGWLNDPSLGPVVIALLGAGAAVAITALAAGLRNRRALWSTLTVVGIGALLWYPLQFLFPYATGLMIAGLAVVTVGVGVLVGFLYGGPDRGQSMRAAGITAFVVGFLIFVDRVMAVWEPYNNSSRVSGRPIATIGAQTPGLGGDYWVRTLDTFTHLLLPTIALTLISFAAYTRYSRASLLEVMNQDYIRTARAKGLPERVVTMRHAFRNALIPLATIIPLDIAALFGGAIITERIFAWSGMGTLFLKALENRDIDVVMGYFLVIGTMLVLANIIVDFIYAALDPRIRVNA